MKFNKLFKRSILGDYDRDGVMNAFDCQPKNKRKQDTAGERAWKKLQEEEGDNLAKEIQRAEDTFKLNKLFEELD